MRMLKECKLQQGYLYLLYDIAQTTYVFPSDFSSLSVLRNGIWISSRLIRYSHQRKQKMESFIHLLLLICLGFLASKCNLFVKSALMSCYTELLWPLFRQVQLYSIIFNNWCCLVLLECGRRTFPNHHPLGNHKYVDFYVISVVLCQ